jgi:hypothetical protein
LFTLRVTGACAADEQRTFTDHNGNAGSSIGHGNKTDFYDASNRLKC